MGFSALFHHTFLRRGHRITDIVVVQLPSCVWLFAAPWTACSMPDLPVPYNLPKFAQVHVHCIGGAIQPSHPLTPSSPSALNLFPASGTFPVSQLFPSDDQNTGVSASASVLATSIQGWFPTSIQGLFPLRLTGLISLLSKGLSGVFSSTTVWRHQFFSAAPSLCHWYKHHLTYWTLCTVKLALIYIILEIKREISRG